jgi:adenylate cyclase
LTNELVLDGNPTTRSGQRAVFLSYASEDAQAAQRICAALRAAGIEVWLDQSELRGGDAWDSAIRKQIKSCALFIPIISANTHARIEGYFRLEWKLAIDRSHLLAPDQPFVVPVAIDNTPQSDDRLPERFRELQWTRLPNGDTPPAFAERIARLLSPETLEARTPSRIGLEAPAGSANRVHRASAPAEGPGSPGQGRKAVRLIVGAIVLGVVCYALVASKHAGGVSGTPGAMIAAAPATQTMNADKSIAVLPFVDMSEKKDQEYFSDGLSDELIDLLGKIPGLRVPARTPSFYFKGRQSTLLEIGRALNVSHVLEGSVRKSGSALRISAELINIANDKRVWSETYDRTLDDVFKVQDDIAGAVVAALKVSMLGDVKPRAAPTNNSEAHLHYLRGQEAFASGDSGKYDTGISEFQKAVALDPSFAEAWTALGAGYISDFALAGQTSFESARREAMNALQRALALNPDLANAHAELARFYFAMDWDNASAQAELTRAQALDPKNGIALWLSGYIANSEGRFNDALRLHNELRDNDPLRIDSYRQLGNAYYRANRLAESAAVFADAAKRFPAATTIHYRLGLVLLAQHQSQAALDEFMLERDPDFRLAGPPLALDKLGRKQEADKALAEAVANEHEAHGAAYQVALIYAARGDADRAFQWLERAYRQRDSGMLWMKFDPLLQPLSRDPRFKTLLAEMHQS